jgi:hypothetical protein
VTFYLESRRVGLAGAFAGTQNGWSSGRQQLRQRRSPAEAREFAKGKSME